MFDLEYNPRSIDLNQSHPRRRPKRCETKLYSHPHPESVNTVVIHAEGLFVYVQGIPSILPLTGAADAPSCLLLDLFRRLLETVVALLIRPSGSETDAGEGRPCSPLEQED